MAMRPPFDSTFEDVAGFRRLGEASEAPRPIPKPPVRTVVHPLPSKAGARFSRLTSWLVFLLAASFLVPMLVERVQFALTRGRQRAEYEVAGVALHSAGLGDLSRACQLISKRVSPSVVHISTIAKKAGAPSPGLGRGGGVTQGQGSGVIVDAEGYVLTNIHVISDSYRIFVKLSDGRRERAEIVGVDKETDLAVLKISANGLVAAEWGDSDQLEVGALVWALGSPFGLERSVTFGILSAKHRAGAGTLYQDFLQTDAAVNPGNSGGPLVDAHGRVVGINTAIVGETYQGISFAIPSTIARRVFEDITRYGWVRRGWLGVMPADVPPEMARRRGMPEHSGAYIREVTGQPALRAGIQVRDIILRWNGDRVKNRDSFFNQVAQTPIGATVEVVVNRDGKEIQLSVAVAERPGTFP